MFDEEKKLHQLRRERIARTRKLLRWMPRKTNIHRYPVLKWFAAAARKRFYFWSFRTEYAIPALWAGFILSLMPLYGIQIPLALLFAYILKANLPILVGLQLITNPITVFPIYFTCYQIGRLALSLFGIPSPQLSFYELSNLINSAEEGHWVYNAQYFFKIWSITSLGSLILGIFFATISVVIYRFMAKEVALTYHKLREFQKRRREQQAEEKE